MAKTLPHIGNEDNDHFGKRNYQAGRSVDSYELSYLIARRLFPRLAGSGWQAPREMFWARSIYCISLLAGSSHWRHAFEELLRSSRYPKAST